MLTNPLRRRFLRIAQGLLAALWPARIDGEHLMTVGFGNRSHLRVQPHVRDRLIHFYSEVLGCGAPVTLRVSGLTGPMVAFRFPGGGSMSFEFTSDALAENDVRRGAWLELQTDDVDGLRARVTEAGVERVTYVTPTFYFAAPGGQVFGIVPLAVNGLGLHG